MTWKELILSFKVMIGVLQNILFDILRNRSHEVRGYTIADTLPLLFLSADEFECFWITPEY